MTDEAGRRTFRELSARADVVVENLGPGTMESWGCSYADLRADNTELVMLAVSGYGRSGPLAGFRAYASNISNFIGHTLAWAPDGIHFDFVAGIHGACAVVAALAKVARGSGGVYIDMAQTETGARHGARPLPGLPGPRPGVERRSQRSAGLALLGGLRVPRRRRLGGGRARGCQGLGGPLHLLRATRPRTRRSRCRRRPSGGRGLGRDGHAPSGDAGAAGARPGGRSRTGQRGPVARSAAPQPGRPRRGLPSRPRVSGVSGRPVSDTPPPAAPRISGPRLGEHTAEVLDQWLGRSRADVETLQSSGAVWVAEGTADPSC